MVICLEQGADCLHVVQLMPLLPKPPSSLASFKFRLVLPFWYRLSHVLEKRPLNGCSSSSSSIRYKLSATNMIYFCMTIEYSHCYICMWVFNFVWYKRSGLCIVWHNVVVAAGKVTNFKLSYFEQVGSRISAILMQVTNSGIANFAQVSLHWQSWVNCKYNS